MRQFMLVTIPALINHHSRGNKNVFCTLKKKKKWPVRKRIKGYRLLASGGASMFLQVSIPSSVKLRNLDSLKTSLPGLRDCSKERHH